MIPEPFNTDTPLTDTLRVEAETLKVYSCGPAQVPLPAKALPVMTDQELIDKGPSQCPKCGKFVQRILIATDEHLPGYWCSGADCGWMDWLPGQLKRICTTEEAIPKELFWMLCKAPLNDHLRAHVLAAVGKPVPKSCQTIVDIERWIESTYIPLWGAPIKRRTTRTHGVSIEVSYSYTESGTATYTCNRSGSSEYEISGEELREMAETCDTFDRFRRAVSDNLRDSCEEDPPDTDSDSYEYGNEESTDQDNTSCEIHRGTLEDALREWLDEHMPDAFQDRNDE
jgi:hypothetical protein